MNKLIMKKNDVFYTVPMSSAWNDVEEFKQCWGMLHPSAEEVLEKMGKDQLVRICMLSMASIAGFQNMNGKNAQLGFDKMKKIISNT